MKLGLYCANIVRKFTFLNQQRLSSLRTLGFAVEYFPGYISRKTQMHSLDVVLLSLVIRGRGKHIIEAESFEETGASLAVTHYGQQHALLTDEKGMDVINLYLDLQNHSLPVLPREFHSVLPLLLPLHPGFQNRLNRIVRLEFDDPGPLAELLFSIQHELDVREPGYEEVAVMLFKLFLIRCCRHAKRKGFAPSEPASRPLRALTELRNFLDRHYAEPHTLASLAKMSRLSRTYLCRAFKAYTGKRIFDYLIERRIQAAMMRLRSGDEKILGIALDCGFNDLSHFNRKFRQIVGVTPSRYRCNPGQ